MVQQVKLIMVRLSDVSFSLPYSHMAEAFYESQYLSDFQLSVVKLKGPLRTKENITQSKGVLKVKTSKARSKLPLFSV